MEDFIQILTISKKGNLGIEHTFQKKINIKESQKVFEASPLYLFNPLCPKRIYELVPNVKLILLLRNPTERAISHYFHEKRRNTEFKSIDDALQKEEERLKPIIDRADYQNPNFINFSYKQRGLYKKQLEKYLYYFDWDQFLIISSEDFFRNPSANLEKIFDFLNIDKDINLKQFNMTPRNIGSNKKNVNSSIYEYLNNFFEPHNQELYRLIGKEFDW